MKREIPQKVDAKFGFADQIGSASVAQFCATLFRRTRSASLLSVTLTAGTLGIALTSQKAEAFPAKASGLLEPVSSLPHLFNSADASSKTYSSNYLALQGIENSQADMSQTMLQSVSFQSSGDLATKLALQPVPEIALSSKSPTDASLPSTAADSLGTSNATREERSVQSDVAANSIPLALEDADVFVHKVRAGENLTEIAEKYSVSPETIVQTNRIANPNVIDTHENLVIPAVSLSTIIAAPMMMGALAGDTAVVLHAAKQQGISAELLDPQKIDKSTVHLPPAVQLGQPIDLEAPGAVNAQISVASGLQKQTLPQEGEVLALNEVQTQSPEESASQVPDSAVARRVAFPQVPGLDLPALVSAEQFLPSTLQNDLKKYIWPAKGVFTSGYGWRWGRMHRGIDIAAPVGTPVVSAASGIVISAGWNDGGYGNLVEIKHSDGSVTVYAHNSRIVTRVGALVNQGELIAQMGSTGRSTGPHSHFEIRPRGSGAVDPMFFLGRS